MIYTKEIKIDGSYDLIVCGGGPSGCAAALAAGREGLKVLLVEGQNQLGGMATSGLVAHWLGGRTQEGEWVVGGIFRSLAEEAASSGYATLPVLLPGQVYQPHGWLPWFIHGIPLDPFGMAHFLDTKMSETGIDVLLGTQAMDVITDEDRITHIVLQNKGGLTAVSAPLFVDATGDADIAARSGCFYRKGRARDGLTTPVTLGFHVSGVDHGELSRYIHQHRTPKFREKITRLREQGLWPFPYDIFISVQLVKDDEAMINTSRIIGIDGIDGRSLSKGLAQGRAESQQLMTLLRDHFPGFRNASIKAVATMLGVRETRRIEGDFELTVDDLVSAREFDDTIGFSIYGWDLPDPQKPSEQPLVDESRGGYDSIIQKSLSTPIPYRIMLPKPVKNLICAGRSVSVERDVLGPLRVMAPCMAMGEAAGVAASLARQAGFAFADVPVDELREKLRGRGAIVDLHKLPPIYPRKDPA